jgi:alkylhydroperoxidase/carboxymuconolactone decarboxylase family protein YurZ
VAEEDGIPPGLDAVLRHYGPFIEDVFTPFHDELYRVTGLDKKTTELVLIALLTMERWKTGLQVHAKMATAAGCTTEEVRGAALITLAVRGLPECSEALGWLDEVLS